MLIYSNQPSRSSYYNYFIRVIGHYYYFGNCILMLATIYSNHKKATVFANRLDDNCFNLLSVILFQALIDFLSSAADRYPSYTKSDDYIQALCDHGMYQKFLNSRMIENYF